MTQYAMPVKSWLTKSQNAMAFFLNNPLHTVFTTGILLGPLAGGGTTLLTSEPSGSLLSGLADSDMDEVAGGRRGSGFGEGEGPLRRRGGARTRGGGVVAKSSAAAASGRGRRRASRPEPGITDPGACCWM